jgi:hypothetical protein
MPEDREQKRRVFGTACGLPERAGSQPAQRLKGISEEAGKVPARPGIVGVHSVMFTFS